MLIQAELIPEALTTALLSVVGEGLILCRAASLDVCHDAAMCGHSRGSDRSYPTRLGISAA